MLLQLGVQLIAHSMYLLPKYFLLHVSIALLAWAASQNMTYASPVALPASNNGACSLSTLNRKQRCYLSS
jgi:hypothetical protein